MPDLKPFYWNDSKKFTSNFTVNLLKSYLTLSISQFMISLKTFLNEKNQNKRHLIFYDQIHFNISHFLLFVLIHLVCQRLVSKYFVSFLLAKFPRHNLQAKHDI